MTKPKLSSQFDPIQGQVSSGISMLFIPGDSQTLLRRSRVLIAQRTKNSR